MKFLKQIADYYLEKERTEPGFSLADYTFVFPNKRSAMFMRKYIKEGRTKVAFLPRMTTITAFTQDFCKSRLATPNELLFVLYKAYCKVLKAHEREKQIRDFDTFVYWGNVLLSDFNDVDAYMADAKKLFANVKAEREIASNYLTQDQIEVARILGDKRDMHVDELNFWKHVPSNPVKDNAADQFLSLWEIMGELYNEFKASLQSRGIAYSGMQSAEACHAVREMGADDFGRERYAFIGFYVLSTARTHIFKRLKDLGIADFFWDTASPALRQPGLRAGEFVLPLSREMPAPADFDLQEIDDFPDYTVCPVASNSAQAKVASTILTEWRDSNTLSTGLVLPDERMLMPTLYSISPKISPLNVAMRVSMQSTPFASLLFAIFTMQERACLGSKGRKQTVFYYKDVFEVLSHPYIAMVAPTDAVRLKDLIVRKHLYNVPASDIERDYPTLSFIFRPVASAESVSDVKGYVDELLAGLERAIMALWPASAGEEDAKPYEVLIIRAFGHAADEILTLAQQYGVGMHEHTFFGLLRRMFVACDIRLNGDPVRGLQIMGMEDARVLDFDNLVICSVNERILPKKSSTVSLVPPALRAGYGMPTPEHEEATVSYLFYRLISRAKRLCLIYDSRTPDLASGEMSRFITQLDYLAKGHGKVRMVDMGAAVSEGRTLQIDKDEKVMRELEEFKPGGRLNMSASALKTYIQCPLKFYLQSVRGLRDDKFDAEYMDASSYGSIIHKVAELYYGKLQQAHPGQYLSADILQKELASRHFNSEIEKMALHAMNDIYYHKWDDGQPGDINEIPGEGRVLARVIASYVRKMLECECKMLPFRFVSGEDNGGQKRHEWHIDADHAINFTMSIDRIDRLQHDGEYLRFIDYKTGDDDITASSLPELFEKYSKGAIFQLMLYSLAYSDLRGVDVPIQPMVYRMAKMGKEGLGPIVIGKKVVADFRQQEGDEPYALSRGFRAGLTGLLDQIWDPEVPFTQTPDDKNCLYCQFAHVCGRYVEKKD